MTIFQEAAYLGVSCLPCGPYIIKYRLLTVSTVTFESMCGCEKKSYFCKDD